MSHFPEEQLDSSVGYLPAKLGQTLKDGQWTIVRKLGWGPRSSTWLAVENRENADQYRAIKIMTVAATEDSTGKNERDLLLGLVKNIREGVPELQNYFYEDDTKGKRHLCLVFKPLGNSVEDIRLDNIYHGEYLHIHVVQKVIGDIAKRLVDLSNQKIVHGAVTADNFLFWTVQSGDDIRRVLAKFPSEKEIMIQGSDGVTYPSVNSQPLKNGYTWDTSEEDIMPATIYLGNYAHASAGRTPGVETSNSPKNIGSPEVLQGGKISPESDIWMLGCTAYHLLTGHPLFSASYVSSPIKVATETLGKLENLLRESEKICEKDIPPTASFLRLCLTVKPTKRVTAKEILNGSWARHRDGCSHCGWCGY